MNVGELWVSIRADLGELRKGLQDAQNATKNFADRMKQIGESASRMGKEWSLKVTAPITAGFGFAVKGAAELEGALDKFNVVFRGMEQEMLEWVDQYRSEFPLARREIIAHAAALQDLLVPMGVNREEAAGMTKEWLHLAGALAAFNDVPIEQALNAIRSGIAGQSEPLRQFGINANVAALEQTALAHGLIQAGEKMTDQVRLQALLIQAYEQSADAVNGLEEQKGSFIWTMGELKATLKDVGDEFGKVLLPVVKQAAQRVREALEWFRGLDEQTRKLIIVTAGLAAAVGPLLIAFGGAIALIQQTIQVATTLGVVLRFLAANPIGMVITAIGLLITAGIYLYRNWDEVKHRGLQVWGALKTYILEQVKRIIEAFGRLVSWIPKVGDAVKNAAAGLDEMIADERQTIALRNLERQTRQTEAEVSKLGSAFGDLAGAADVAVPLDDMTKNLDRTGSAARAAGTKAAEAAEDTRAAWERAADILSNRLQILRTEYEIAAMAAEKKGDKAEELRLKLDYLNRQLDVQRDLVAAVKRGYDEVVAAKGADAEESQKLELRLVREQRAQAELEKQVRETTRALRDHAAELRSLAAEAERVADKYRNDLAAAHEEYQRRVAEVNRRLAEDERRITDQYEAELQRRTRALMDWTGLFSQVTHRDVSGEQLLENLRGQVSAFEAWESNIAELAARGVDQGLIEELRQMGPKAGPEIAALLTLTDKQLVEYVALWRQKNEQARREAVNQLQRQRDEMQQRLIEIRNAARQQLEIYRAEWEQKNAEIRRNAEEEMRRIEERFEAIAAAGTKYGVALMDNFTAGIQSRADRLREVLWEIAAMVDAYMPHSPAKVGPLRRLNEWGPALVRGFADGIRRAAPELRRAVAGMAALTPAALGPAITHSYSTSSTSYGPIVINIHGVSGDDVLHKLKRDLHRAGVRWPGGA